ncbi:cob(I)yrinic acid a,c-diamide adenosyltransferase [Patescibacteria group bacterium]|nr:cob(I)yrinic acid a,c-diamide adenosyltransferase [Patescibacteria group bacterium]
MALFYTGKGDKGQSHIGKKKYSKDSPIMEALGDLDELNSLLGVIRAAAKKGLNKKLFLVQENLFIIQARVAWIMFNKFESPQLTQEKIQKMEQEIDAIETKIHPERGFIISGENKEAAYLDYARTIARRAERSVIRLTKKQKLPEELVAYLNRLSGYLYALARLEISESRMKEKKPRYI